MCRTGCYRKPVLQRAKDEDGIAVLREAHVAHQFYGVRRLAIHLSWSENKARRLRRLAGIIIERPSKKHRTGKAVPPEIAAPPNALKPYASFKDEARPQDGMSYTAMTESGGWVQDFTYLWFRGCYHYLAVVLDLKTRQVVGWRLGLRHSSELTLAALLDALSRHPPPSILHSDQGSEYLSQKHQVVCGRLEITLSCSARASPWQNGFMERWFGNFQLELGSLGQFADLAHLHEAIALQIHYYNTKRIHLALKMSPAAYAASLMPAPLLAQVRKDRVLQKVGA